MSRTRTESEKLSIVMERRLRTLMMDTVPGGPSGWGYIRRNLHIYKNRASRVRFLLAVGAMTCAARIGTQSAEQRRIAMTDLFGPEGSVKPQTPEGRYVERHKMLLARMVYRGCLRRGDYKPAPKTREATR